MTTVRRHVCLTDDERQQLRAVTAKGAKHARTVQRAMAVLLLDQGQTLQAVGKLLDVSLHTIAAWRDRYQAVGLAMLVDQPRPGRPKK